MDDKICVGIVGLGLAATAHIRGYLSHTEAVVLAVCDSDRERAAAFGARYGIERVYTSFTDLLADGDVDLIDIATPTFLHATMTRQAAQAGKHIHCEKPFCRSVAEGMEAVRAVEERRRQAAGGRDVCISRLPYEGARTHRKRRHRSTLADFASGTALGVDGRSTIYISTQRRALGGWTERSRAEGLTRGSSITRFISLPRPST